MRLRKPDPAERIFAEQLQRLVNEEEAAEQARLAKENLRQRILKVIPVGKDRAVSAMALGGLLDMGKGGQITPIPQVAEVLHELVSVFAIKGFYNRITRQLEYYRKPPRALTR